METTQILEKPSIVLKVLSWMFGLLFFARYDYNRYDWHYTSSFRINKSPDSIVYHLGFCWSRRTL
jgi:hypothetical protein